MEPSETIYAAMRGCFDELILEGNHVVTASMQAERFITDVMDQAIDDGIRHFNEWRKSPEGREHIKKLRESINVS